jgi:hypothetical protein
MISLPLSSKLNSLCLPFGSTVHDSEWSIYFSQSQCDQRTASYKLQRIENRDGENKIIREKKERCLNCCSSCSVRDQAIVSVRQIEGTESETGKNDVSFCHLSSQVHLSQLLPSLEYLLVYFFSATFMETTRRTKMT